MTKIAMSLLFGMSLLASGCTVHHYHHNAPNKHAKKDTHGKKGKHGKRGHGAYSCPHALPEGHPPVGHGMNPHHGMGAKGMDPHHGMKGHGMDAKEGAGDTSNPIAGGGEGHEQDAEHQAMENLPAPVQLFHDSFAAVWHLEGDDERRSKACAEVTSWKKLAAGVKAHRLVGAGTAAYASASTDLVPKTNAIGTACKRKSGDVQAALKATHDTLHTIFAAVQMSNKTSL